MKKVLGVTLLLLLSNTLKAQKTGDNQFNTWLTYSGDHSVSERIDIHTLYSFRRNEFMENWQQSLLRVGMGVRLADKIKMQVGYDWLVTFPYGKQPISFRTNEHRIWVHLNLKFQEKRFYFANRIRFENRAIEDIHAGDQNERIVDGFNWKYRLRYKFAVDVPLNKNRMEENTLFLSVSDELFMNLFDKNHYFNQNWFYAGLGWRFTEKIKLKIGYMNQFLPKTDGDHVENNHTLSLSYIQNFSFAKNNNQ
jgi:hypothetical protein